MNWIKIEDHLPDDLEDVLVSDGFDSYAVAWYKPSTKTWLVYADLLNAENSDGGCYITIDSAEIKWWAKINQPS